MPTAIVIGVLIAYLLGSISSAIIVCYLFDYPDPRTKGSRNPGATNVLRIAGKKAAFLVLLGDMFKGLIPVLLAKWYGIPPFGLALVAVAAFLGHLYPLYFRFEGGKGVATLIGCLFAFNFLLGLAFIVTWLAVALVFRYSALSSLVATILAPFYTWYFTNMNYTVAVVLMGVLVVYRHRSNIKNLWNGKEDKIGEKKKKAG